MRRVIGQTMKAWVRQSLGQVLLLACLAPLLSACLPGLRSSDTSADSAISAEAEAASPAVNRSYKTSFFGVIPSADGAPFKVQSSLSYDVNANIMTAAIATVERNIKQASFNPQQPAEGDPAVAPATEALKLFYTALADLAAGKRDTPVTILHLGDETIADDRFAGDIRDNLQSRFGNAGRGMMSPGLFPVRGFKVDRSGDWAIESAADSSRAAFGLTGVRATAKGAGSWLRLTAGQAGFDWAEVTFATGPAQGSAIVSIDGETRTVPTASLAGSYTSIKVAAKAREILIKPSGDGAITVHSISTGYAAKGVRYINLGLPGATAATSERWNPALVASELKKLQPDLVILGYGTREAFADADNASQYERKLGQTARQILEVVPQASVLVIGPPDAARLPSFASSASSQVCRGLNGQETAIYDRMLERSDERLARWHAPPALERIRAAWKRTAAAIGAYYWDWAKFMGGPCSIHAWTTAKPPLAAPDHVTLTPPGMERSARGLFGELMAGYDAFQRQQKAITVAAIASPPAEPEPASKKRKKSAKSKRKTAE